jgi:hypothetical protein
MAAVPAPFALSDNVCSRLVILFHVSIGNVLELADPLAIDVKNCIKSVIASNIRLMSHKRQQTN